MGPEAVKRVNVLVTDDTQRAMDWVWWLKKNGVDAKLVTKHAVQVHPDHVQKTKELNEQAIAEHRRLRSKSA